MGIKEIESAMDKTAIVAQIGVSRARLEAALGRLTAAQMLQPGVCGDWSAKDMLGHIVAWEQHMLTDFARLFAGEPVREFADDAEIDAINAATYARCRDVPLAEMQAEFARSHAQVRAWLESVSAEQLARPYLYRRTVAQFIPVDTWEHYDEHTAQIEAAFGFRVQ